jgi:hypothetical protein
MSQYPEHDKLSAVADRTQAVGDFLEWISDRHGARLMAFFEGQGWGTPPGFLQTWLAEWAGIDREKLEQEKRAMLDGLRKRQETTP